MRASSSNTEHAAGRHRQTCSTNSSCSYTAREGSLVYRGNKVTPGGYSCSSENSLYTTGKQVTPKSTHSQAHNLQKKTYFQNPRAGVYCNVHPHRVSSRELRELSSGYFKLCLSDDLPVLTGSGVKGCGTADRFTKGICADLGDGAHSSFS